MTCKEENKALKYLYYLIGELPVRISYIATDVPVMAEILNFKTKNFEIDNLYIQKIAQSLESIQIDKNEFDNICLKNGVKPI